MTRRTHASAPKRGHNTWLTRLLIVGILTLLTAVIIDDRQETRTAMAEFPTPATPAPSLTPTSLAALAPVTLEPTPTDTATALPSLTPTASPTLTPWPTATPTSTPSPTLTPQPSATMTPIPPSPTPLPLPTPQGTMSYTLKVPILMYHYLSVPPEDSDVYRLDLSVDPAAFRTQMEYLAANGYTPIDFYDLSRAIAGQQELPLRPVVISIDDGYRDFYYNAFPILREFGFTATLIVVTAFVDHGNPNYVTWDMVTEMAAAGIRIEPHSKSHPDLRDRDRSFLVYEILGSLESVEARTGYRPRFFAYPGGRYDEAAIAILKELNFWGAVTTAGGTWHGFNDRFEWSRLRVRNTTTLPEFADLVSPDETLYGKAPHLAPSPTPPPTPTPVPTSTATRHRPDPIPSE